MRQPAEIYPQHGIIFAENHPQNRKSAILFQNQYCLAPATVLLNAFNEYQNQVRTKSDHDLAKDLKINRIIDTVNDRRYRCLSKHNYKLIHDRQDSLVSANAKILYIFKCKNIYNSFNDILQGFVAKSFSTTTSITVPTSTVDDDLHKLLLSSFVILTISTTPISDPIPPLDIFTKIVDSNTPHVCTGPKERNVEVFRVSSVKKLENVESISTPFGNECFLNTINVGKVANIFGDSKCLMVASMPLVYGCEGGAVYNRHK